MHRPRKAAQVYVPEYVYRDQHPLRTGVPGRKYSPFDYVKPIIDSMQDIDDKAHGTGMRGLVYAEQRRRERDLMGCAREASCDFAADEHASHAKFARPSKEFRDSLCSNCGTNKRTDILLGSDGRYVCKCGAEGAMVMGDDFKDTHNTDKSSARADVFRPSQALVRSTSVPEAAKRKHRLGKAAEMSERAADREAFALTKGNQRKLTAIVVMVDDLLNEIGRVDDKVARKVRMDAESVFRESVRHHSVCRRRECQKTLFEKPVGVIARESVVFTLDQLSSTGMDGMSIQSIVALQQRVRSSHVFSQRVNATQHQSCLAMISALSTSNNDIPCPEAKSPEERVACKAGGSLPFSRQQSDADVAGLVQLRDAISRLSVEYACSSGVRDGAMCAMQDANFVKRLAESEAVSADKCKLGTAYVILRSVAEMTGDAQQIKAERYVRRAGLETKDVESMVSAVRAILPRDVVDGRVVDDDELY